ncbi:unnamed protein product [Arabidopsis halleri]
MSNPKPELSHADKMVTETDSILESNCVQHTTSEGMAKECILSDA